MNTWTQLIGVAITTASFIGAILLAALKLMLTNTVMTAKDEILTKVREEFQAVAIAQVKEEEFRRRLRLLEQKTFGQTNGE